MKHAWAVSVKTGTKEFLQCIERLKCDVGILPRYDSVFTVRGSAGANYKTVAKKVILVSAQDPEAAIPAYRDIPIGEL